MSLRLLIVEDAADVAEVIAFGAHLTWPGCQVRIAASGAEAIHSFTTYPADLVVLDVAMPPPDGFEICRHIRSLSRVPILMLTVRDAISDKVRALDLGADDYLTKPFDALELFARLRALLRRASEAAEDSDACFVSGVFELNFESQQVRIGGELIPLTSTEYRLLEELVHNAGMMVGHQALLERVWGPAYAGDTHYLKVVVQRLRQKLRDNADVPRYIQTVWGSGYRFIAPH